MTRMNIVNRFIIDQSASAYARTHEYGLGLATPKENKRRVRTKMDDGEREREREREMFTCTYLYVTPLVHSSSTFSISFLLLSIFFWRSSSLPFPFTLMTSERTVRQRARRTGVDETS